MSVVGLPRAYVLCHSDFRTLRITRQPFPHELLGVYCITWVTEEVHACVRVCEVCLGFWTGRFPHDKVCHTESQLILCALVSENCTTNADFETQVRCCVVLCCRVLLCCLLCFMPSFCPVCVVWCCFVMCRCIDVFICVALSAVNWGGWTPGTSTLRRVLHTVVVARHSNDQRRKLSTSRTQGPSLPCFS